MVASASPAGGAPAAAAATNALELLLSRSAPAATPAPMEPFPRRLDARGAAAPRPAAAARAPPSLAPRAGPIRDAQPTRRRGGTALSIAAAAVAIMLGLGGGYFLMRADVSGAPTKIVSLYVTDLPGGLERFRITVAGALVGSEEFELAVEAPEVEISALRGPEQGLRIASGEVPESADGRVSLIFGGARGYKDGRWIAVDVPQARLTLGEACPADARKACSALFDFNLDESLVPAADGSFQFLPFVQEVYRTAGEDAVPERLDLARLERVERFDQERTVIERERLAAMCGQIGGCGSSGTKAPTSGSGASTTSSANAPGNLDVPKISPSSSTTATTSATTTTSTTTTTTNNQGPTNAAPNKATNPSPANGATDVRETTVTLSWSGSDPDAGDTLQYRVYLSAGNAPNDLRCDWQSATTCTVSGLEANSYTWRVDAKDNHGAERSGDPWTFSVRPPSFDADADPGNCAPLPIC